MVRFDPSNVFDVVVAPLPPDCSQGHRRGFVALRALTCCHVASKWKGLDDKGLETEDLTGLLRRDDFLLSLWSIFRSSCLWLGK